MFYNKKKIIKHYANVLFEHSKKMNLTKFNCFYHKIKKIYYLLHKNHDFNKIIYSKIFIDQKIKIFEKIFLSFDILLFNFIKLLILKKREFLLKEIFLEYQKIYKKEKGFIECSIISAYPLSINIQKKIAHKITLFEFEYVDKKFHIINKIDKSIIGGFIFIIGNKEWDISIKKQFFLLKKTFKNY
ncbi:ATP synthase F1 subunit delta [Blattabacterium cuenoti]|uniref:ATP synthase F1 subunit delta n=1 Tax=Blattabacterium cuenoti TaxID=1653831 RepID=UPI00163C6A9F|nr:ATP synthase F1 subunit delta [Blattabacterium cuenoti]